LDCFGLSAFIKLYTKQLLEQKHNIYAVPFGRAFHYNLLGRRIFISIPNGKDYRINNISPEDPAQYTRLIFFTPAANKPGELRRINTLEIEIGSFLTNHNSRLIKL
jgi:hypothetical protein